MRLLFAFACALSAIAALVANVQGEELRGAVIALEVPLWILAWQGERRG
jgi:hypothetical protein